jgi:Tol biopolymer transport system component
VFEPWDRVPPAPWTALGALSADGSRVLFQSNASDLVPGDVPGTLDVFVRDRKTGADQRLSVTPAGAGANGRSSMAGMSRDGRWAAFRSDASDLVAGDTNRRTDLFVRGPLPTS